MLAAAFLTITAAAEHAHGAAPDGQIPLTRNEIGHLLAALIVEPVHGIWHRLCWSAWRRRHQHAPGPATTSGRPGNYEDHELRLEY